MENSTKKLKLALEPQPMALGDLIHQHVRAAVEQAVHEELARMERPAACIALALTRRASSTREVLPHFRPFCLDPFRGAALMRSLMAARSALAAQARTASTIPAAGAGEVEPIRNAVSYFL